MARYSFAQKLSESEDMDLRAILDSVYLEFFPPGTVESIEYENNLEFQSNGCDLRVTLRAPQGRSYIQTIEEKIRSPKRSHYSDLCVEYVSNAERGTVGCICTSKADWLSYVRQPENEIIVVILPMQLFKRWFMARMGKYSDLPVAATTVLDNGNSYTTMSKTVPWNDEGFKAFRSANGCFVKTIKRSHKEIPTDRSKQRMFDWS